MRATECQGRYPVAALQNMMLRMREVKGDRPFAMKRFILYKSTAYMTTKEQTSSSALHRDLAATLGALRDSLTIAEPIFSSDLQLSGCGPSTGELGPQPDALSCDREHL
jgi:hypothetical protein